MSAFEVLTTGLIDYAGLFPPAALSMRDAALEHRRWRTRPEAWIVGRFVCPVGRLAELAREAGDMNEDRWDLSVLAGDALETDLDAITSFLDESAGRFDVPSLEIKVASIEGLESCLDALESVADAVTAWFEFPPAFDSRGFITALAGTRHGAKIRTGGLTPDHFPSVERLAAFILACRDAQVPFKATAGLHHPLRRRDAKLNCTMHGFLNLFLAAAGANSRHCPDDALRAILSADDPVAFSFDGEQCRALDWTFSAQDVARGRRLAVSFGSCSIAEPVDDLHALGLLPIAAGARRGA